LRNHPYILSTVIATFLATIVWLCIPKKYTAITKLSDEFQETELAIGLSQLQANIKNVLGTANVGINDIEVYSKVLETDEFLRAISCKKVPGKGISYGDYLGRKDTIEAVKNNIHYNYSDQQATLTISFTDKNALIAAQMLDSTVNQLQHIITHYRHSRAEKELKDTEKKLKEAQNDYINAQEAYIEFSDNHIKSSSHKINEEERSLKREMSLAHTRYREITTQYVRLQALKKRIYSSFVVIQNNTVPQKTNEHYAGYLLSFIFIAIILTKWYILYNERITNGFEVDAGDVFSPWSLTIISWGSVVSLYYLQGTLYPLGPKFISCVILWLITFLPSSYISYLLGKKKGTRRPNFKIPIHANMWLFHLLFFVSIFMTIAYARTIWSVVSQFDTENLLYNIRLLAVFEDLNHGILNYTHGLNFALFFVAMWLYPRISKYQLIAIFILNMIIEIAMMEKSGILIMILGTLFVLYERAYISKKVIATTLASTILFFFFFNMAKQDSSSEESTAFLDFFGIYVTSPIVAFERLEVTITENFAPNTFTYIYPYINKLGFNFESIERLQDFVFVPIPTNVYTIMQPFYNDFGKLGVAFFGFAYGSLFGLAYLKFREGDPIFRCLYIYLVEVIIIQFYNENLLQAFFIVAVATVFVCLMVQQWVKLSISKTNNS